MECLGEDCSYEDMENLVFNFLLTHKNNENFRNTSTANIARELGMHKSGAALKPIIKRLWRKKLIRRDRFGWFVYGRRTILQGQDPPAFRNFGFEISEAKKRKLKSSFIQKLI